MSYEKNNSQNESERNFVILPRAVLRAGVSATARVVFAELASYYRGEDSAIYPAYSTIAAAVGFSRRTVIRAVAELVDAGILEKKTTMRENRGGYGTNIYFLRGDKYVTSRGDKNVISRGDKNVTMNKRNQNNKNNILKNIISRAHAREEIAAAAVHDAAEETVQKNKDLQILEIFKQAKNSKWFELVRINQSYCLRPYSEISLRMVQSAEFNILCDVITQNAGSCRPLNVGQHFLDEVVIK